MLQRFIFALFSEGSYPGLRAISLCKRQKLGAESRGTLGEVVARKALEQGVQRKRAGRGSKFSLTLTSLKSSTFVNLHLVINGPNEFAKDHQAQTYRPSAGG
jgi:hypothetical protein